MQEQRQPNVNDVFHAIKSGRWDEVDRIKEQVGSFSHDKLPGNWDVLSELASITGYSHVCANALTGVRICIEYGADPNAMQGGRSGLPLPTTSGLKLSRGFFNTAPTQICMRPRRLLRSTQPSMATFLTM
ncbi:MAG: hypothetical protein C4341_08780 [Armatimonadota bacterium]